MSDVLILNDEKKSWNDNIVDNDNLAVETKGFFDKINDYVLSLQKVKTKEKVIFYRLLSTMTNAWMSLVKWIDVLQKQEKNELFKKILWEVHTELKSWKTLSEALELYPSSFSDAEIWIIKSGEKTGQLNETLTDLANQIEKVESISGKIKSAMMYPMFIILVVVGVISVMMTAVVPKLLEIFEWNTDLPASTKLLITISDTFRDYWFVMIIVICSIVLFVSIWKKTPDGKYLFDGLMLKIPVFGGINNKLLLSKFSRVFAGLLGSWVSVVESLKITSEAVWNEVYKQRILLLAEDVKQWIKMWESLDGDKLFPEMMVQMIQVWEQTAKLDHTIIRVADFYDEQVDNTIAVLNKLLEPFIIVFLAVVVWFIAVAIMQPIMNLADTISNW